MMFCCSRFVCVCFLMAVNYRVTSQCDNSEEIEIAKSLYKTGNIDIAEITNLSEEKKNKYCNHNINNDNNAETQKPEDLLYAKSLYKAGKYEDLNSPITLDTIKKKLRDSGVFDADDESLTSRERKEVKKLFESVEIMMTSRARQPSSVQNLFTALRMVERAVKKQLKEGQISETLASKFQWEKIHSPKGLGSNKSKVSKRNRRKKVICSEPKSAETESNESNSPESNELKSSESNESNGDTPKTFSVYLPKIFKDPTKMSIAIHRNKFDFTPSKHLGGSLSFIYKYKKPNSDIEDSKNNEKYPRKLESTTENVNSVENDIKTQSNYSDTDFNNTSSEVDKDNSTTNANITETNENSNQTNNSNNQTTNLNVTTNFFQDASNESHEVVVDELGYTIKRYYLNKSTTEDSFKETTIQDSSNKIDSTTESLVSDSTDNIYDYPFASDSDYYADSTKKWTQPSQRWLKQLS